MMRRTGAAIAYAAAAAAALSSISAAPQGPRPPQNRSLRTWTGTIDDEEVRPNEVDTAPIHRPVDYAHDIHVEFTFVSETDSATGDERWLSRKVAWTATGKSISSVQGTECKGAGSFDLGPAARADDMTPEQLKQFRIPCRSWQQPGVFAFNRAPPQYVPVPRIRTDVQPCGPPLVWREPDGRYSLAVSGGGIEARLTQARSAAFVPAPGARADFEVWASTPVDWRIVIVESSALRGYANNADVDLAFFEIFSLPALKGRYGTRDPDLIFDPSHFEPPFDQTGQWKRPEPGSGPAKWHLIETKTPTNDVRFDVTAMDFGAHGEVQAFYRDPACAGTWVNVANPDNGDNGVRLPADV